MGVRFGVARLARVAGYILDSGRVRVGRRTGGRVAGEKPRGPFSRFEGGSPEVYRAGMTIFVLFTGRRMRVCRAPKCVQQRSIGLSLNSTWPLRSLHRHNRTLSGFTVSFFPFPFLFQFFLVAQQVKSHVPRRHTHQVETFEK